MLSLKASKWGEGNGTRLLEESREAKLKAVKEKLCTDFGLDTSRTRIWKYGESGQRISLEAHEEASLGDCFWNEDELMLEEKSADGIWPSGASCSAASSASGSALTPSPPTESPTKLPAVELALAPSVAGMRNLGNTCFMSSSLTCLANVPALRDYFLTGGYRNSLKVNGLETERTRGTFAEGFNALMTELWDGKTRVVAPSKFKQLIARTNDHFSGFRQHDSMEFLEFLIDALKEDCNMVKGRKPYFERPDNGTRPERELALEAANYFILRSDSFIDDLFVGFFKSVTICPEECCGRQAFVFDPFLSVKLPLVNRRELSERTLEMSVVASGSHGLARITVTLDSNASVIDVIRSAAEQIGKDAANCILVELFKGAIFKFFDRNEPVRKIKASDKLALYELASAGMQTFEMTDPRRFRDSLQREDNIIVARSFMSVNKKSEKLVPGMYGKVEKIDDAGDAYIDFETLEKNQWVLKSHFGHLLNLNSQEQRTDPRDNKSYILREVAESFANDYSATQKHWQQNMLNGSEASESLCTVYFRKMTIGPHGRSFDLIGIPLLLCMPRSLTVGEIQSAIGAELERHFGTHTEEQSWYVVQECESEELKELREVQHALPSEASTQMRLQDRPQFVLQLKRTPEGIKQALEDAGEIKYQDDILPLETCFEWSVATEQVSGINQVYCPDCRDHRDVYKRLELWSLPPVLILQLKRFYVDENGLAGRRRLNTAVRYPLDGLDLRRFCDSGVTSFPEGECLRAGRDVEIHGLQSTAGQKLNGLQGRAMYLQTSSQRFCVRMKEDEPPEQWKKVKPENLRPVPLQEGPQVAPPLIYDLAALSKHIGNESYGHYVSYARSSEDGLWRWFDDDEVKQVSPETVAAEHIGAYVLVYLRRDQRPAAWGPPPEEICDSSEDLATPPPNT